MDQEVVKTLMFQSKKREETKLLLRDKADLQLESKARTGREVEVLKEVDSQRRKANTLTMRGLSIIMILSMMTTTLLKTITIFMTRNLIIAMMIMEIGTQLSSIMITLVRARRREVRENKIKRLSRKRSELQQNRSEKRKHFNT